MQRWSGFVLTVGLVLAALTAPDAGAGSFPRLEWGGKGGVDWASGYVVAYGSGTGPSNLANRNLQRAAAQRAAYLEAARNLMRLCLGITVTERLTVRDFLREDAELRENLDKGIRGLPPWGIRLDAEGIVQVALRLPLGGEGGLSEILGSLTSRQDPVGADAPFSLSGGGFTGEGATGIVLLASRKLLEPALRPRIVDGAGRLLVTWESADEEARSRPAFVTYYHSISEALKDPVVGRDPLVVAADQRAGPGTDIALPPAGAWDGGDDREWRSIMRKVKIAVVLQ